MPIDNLGGDFGQVGVGLDAIELAGLDERGDDGPVLAAAVGASEERILAREGDWPDAALDHVGIDLNVAVVKKVRQPTQRTDPADRCDLERRDSAPYLRSKSLLGFNIFNPRRPS